MLSIRPVDNTVLVGPREMLRADVVRASAPVWTSGQRPTLPLDCHVQLRAHGMTSEAQVDAEPDGTLVARLVQPQTGVAAGQALVLYVEDEVVGSATITSAERVTVTA